MFDKLKFVGLQSRAWRVASIVVEMRAGLDRVVNVRKSFESLHPNFCIGLEADLMNTFPI